MKRIEEPWLQNVVAQALLAALESAGFKGFFVGGCVRNALLGLPVTDLDIATDARPETVIQLAREIGFKPIPTGIDHGTVTVIGQGEQLEVTTFRKDVETDGRHAVIAFADTLEEDAARRDFRMNAIYADALGDLHDPTGGLDDIDARRLVFVGSPDARIREDYLRIIRLYRFAAQLGFGAGGLDPQACQAARRLSYGLSHVSAERKTVEILKILEADCPLDVLRKMAADGVLGRVLGPVDLTLLARYLNGEKKQFRPDAVARLAVLSMPSEAQPLKLRKKDQRFVTQLRRAVKGGHSLGELAYRHGDRLARAAGLAGAALLGRDMTGADLAIIAKADGACFPVCANDLAPRTGKALGAALERLERRWIESAFELSTSELLAELSDEE